MTVNPDFLKEKLVYSKKYIERLKRIIKIPKKEFLEDFSLQLQSERIFEVISQLMLDICTHIVAHSSETPPSSYSDCMNKLVNVGIIKEEESNNFINIIKMRNLLVHQYGTINLEILYASLNRLDSDFGKFKEIILSWIKKLE
ncbi:MAG: type VII toxin-antitoxin system HepT family RNase toxin [Candidatus Heimdallarchaeaceae archaeon]